MAPEKTTTCAPHDQCRLTSSANGFRRPKKTPRRGTSWWLGAIVNPLIGRRSGGSDGKTPARHSPPPRVPRLTVLGRHGA